MQISSDSPWAGYFTDSVLLNMGTQQGQPDLYTRESFNMDNKYHAGGAVVWNTPRKNLRASITYNRLVADALLRTDNPQLRSFEAEIHLQHYICLSLEYSGPKWSATVEYMNARFKTDLLLPGANSVIRESEGYYVMINRRIKERFDVFAYQSIYYPNTKDRSGETYELLAAATGNTSLYPSALGWQKDTCVGIRYDLNHNWTLKSEYHYIDGVGQLYPADNLDGFKRHWNLFTIKASYAF